MARKGHKVKDVTGMQNILFDLKPNRSEAEVYMSADIDVTKYVNYIKKLKETNKNITYFHGFVHIMGKLLYKYPKLNRFVQNRTLFEHDDVSIAFVAKAEFNDKSEEFMTCLPIGKDDTENVEVHHGCHAVVAEEQDHRHMDQQKAQGQTVAQQLCLVNIHYHALVHSIISRIRLRRKRRGTAPRHHHRPDDFHIPAIYSIACSAAPCNRQVYALI